MLANLDILNLEPLRYFDTYGIFLAQLVIVWAVARFIYQKDGISFAKTNFRVSPFESTFWLDWAWYCGWAAIQQSIIVVLATWLDLPYGWAVAGSILMFAVVYHFPNWDLMAATGALGVLMYPLFYYGYSSLIFMALLHGFGGVCYKRLGLNMKVWRFSGQ